ncbi:MAG TPA: YlxR family protein [Mycobacteriales bacterium]|nr:YlxR family protein [Mycobacteriales bacterium]
MSAGVDSPTAHRKGPVRTCAGCRVRADRAGLLRVVVADGVLVVDPGRRLPGRGASVHPDPACVDLADKRRAFARALRVDGPLDVTPVRQYVNSLQDPDGKQVETP